MTTALIQIDTGLHRACHGWLSLGNSEVVQLVVTSSPEAGAQADAKALFDRLVATLDRSGLQRRPTRCGDTFGPGAHGCWATRHPGAVRRVVIWVADASGGLPPVDLDPPGAPWTTVLPILPTGASVSVLPGHLAHTVAVWRDRGMVGALAPDVLIAAGVHLDAFRVFISYRWDDAQAFAEQLFDGLSHEQFDVYLDRFRTNPGANFAERIRAELADKACVVLLDSRNVSSSSWVAGEYGFARLYKLGLMAIDLPGGTKSFRRIGTRLDLRSARTGAPFTGTTPLDPADVASAVAFVRRHYFAQTSRRFRHQRRLILSAAHLAGVAARARPDGLIEANGRYLIAASARPPGIDTFRRACEAAASRPPLTGVVVGPLAAQLHGARQDVGWLADQTGSAAVDERRILGAMRQMGAGSL